MDSREKARNYLSIDRIAEYKQSDIDSLTCLLDKCVEEARAEQRQKFVGELTIYLMDVHHGLTREDAKIVEYFLSATGECDE